jgi:methionyl aminopeptidase
MDREFVNGMRKAGRLAAKVLAETCKLAQVGATTNELDKFAHDFTLSNGGTNACLGYQGFPKSICTSPNEVICHGVPDDKKLKSGDVLNIDVTVKVGPYHGDTSQTIIVGSAKNDKSVCIVNAALGAMTAGIKVARPFGHTNDIGYATMTWLKKNYPEFHICQQIGGHGIGKIFHDKPFIPGVGTFGTGPILKPWTCITVEPVVWEDQGFESEDIKPLEGHDKCNIKVFRAKGGLSAQFEHTLLITDSGYEILTELE